MNRFSLFLLALCLLVSSTVCTQVDELQLSTSEDAGVPSKAVMSLFNFFPEHLPISVSDKEGTAYPPYSITPVDAFKGIEGPFRVAGSYAWSSSATLQLKAHYVNWISALGITFCPEGDNVILNVTENFTSGDGITIKGSLQ